MSFALLARSPLPQCVTMILSCGNSLQLHHQSNENEGTIDRGDVLIWVKFCPQQISISGHFANAYLRTPSIPRSSG